MDDKSIIKSYKRVSSFYDYTFGKVFRPGQKKLVSMMECDSVDKVLEIGIGTGTSYSYYPEDTSVIGIDISPDMLEKAKNHIKSEDLKNKSVVMMNGEQLEFDDNSFDKVVGMYVVSVTQNPDLLIKEMKRVCKTNGDIYLVNHFSFDTDNPLIKTLEKCNDKMTPEDIQTLIYSTGKENGYSDNLRDWFKLIYEVVFGDENGPRMGFFISFFGVKETKDLILNKIR